MFSVINRIGVVLFLVLSISACNSLPYLIAYGPLDPCRDAHPVIAQSSYCPTPIWYDDEKYGPYDAVTSKNANDQPNGTCLLESAASYGNTEVLKKLIAKGARPDMCKPGLEKRIAYGLLHNCTWLRGHVGKSPDVSGTFSTLDSIGVTSSPQSILDTACELGCGYGVSYALSMGADPNRVMHCKASLPKQVN